MSQQRLGASYNRLLLASATSNLGDGATVSGAYLLASLFSRDPWHVAAIGFAYTLPWLLFALLAGAIADRFDRRKLLVVAQVLRFLTASGFALAVEMDRAGLLSLYLFTFLLGTAETIFDTSAESELPSMVEVKQLERANGRLFAAEFVGHRLAGPPVGSALFAFARSAPFLLISAAYGLSLAMVTLLAGRPREQSPPPRKREGLATEIGQGMRWLWAHPLLRGLGVIAVILNFLMAGIASTFVLFAQEILGLDAFWFGFLLAAGAVGGAAGSLVAESLGARFGRGRTMLVSLFVNALMSAGIAVTSSAILVAFLFGLSAAATLVFSVLGVSLRQRITPPEVLGRVAGTFRFAGAAGMPIGALAGGLLARVHLTMPFWLGAAGGLAVTLGAISLFSERKISEAIAEADARRARVADDGDPSAHG